MARRRLKVFQAHLGFYDTIVAAPSQKAALAAWGATEGEFAKGFARLVRDPALLKLALAHPGEVLKRPFGSADAYKLDADRIAIPKLARPKARASRTKEREKKRQAEKEKAAEREMEEVRQQELRGLMSLRKREDALEKEKAMVREKAEKRMARVRARIAGSSRQ